MKNAIDTCPQCDATKVSDGALECVSGHYVGRERSCGFVRLAYACDFGHCWNHKLRIGDPRIPPPAPQQGARPAPAPTRCHIVTCERHASDELYCVEHKLTKPLLAEGTNS